MDLAALGRAAAGLIFNGCSSCTKSLDVDDLLVCERPVDGFSWSPPGRALQADAVWEVVVVQDVVLQGSFPELLPAGPTARLRVRRWRRARPELADEAVHGKHFAGKTLVEGEMAQNILNKRSK